MNSFIETPAELLPCAHSFYCPMGSIESFRQILDPAGRLMVSVFPFSAAKGLAAVFAGVPGCYILSDRVKIYVGETKDMEQRSTQHISDPTKAFARKVYLIHGQHPHSLGRSACLYVEHRLLELADDAGFAGVTNVASALVLPWSDEERATYERFVADALRLLYDAGCRAFHCNFATLLPPQSVTEISARSGQNMQLELNVPIITPRDGELDLAYCRLFARGYWDAKGFVVLPGAELREPINTSANENIGEYRRKLNAAQAVAPIRGLKKRLRFHVSMRVESAAVAAKILTGAHVASTKWVRLSYPLPAAD